MRKCEEDTGIVDHDRYFDVSVEYAKEAPEDLLLAICVCNRGPEAAMAVACARLRTPSFPKILCTWVLTVPTVRTSVRDLCVGCVSRRELQQRPPLQAFDSHRFPGEIVLCRHAAASGFASGLRPTAHDRTRQKEVS